MAGSHVVYRQSFNDGKIVLYQLHERPKRYWICRIKVPGGKGYIYRGSGTSDLYAARRFADDLLDDMKIRLKLGQSVTGTRFSKLVTEYESCIGASGSPTNRQTAILALMKTYAEPYFAKNKITDITTAEVSRFFDWRRANFKKRLPSEATILHESSQFRTFLNWCHRRGLIDKQVIIDNPKRETNRRPHFDHNDWAILAKFLDHWVSDGKTKSGPIYRDRLMLAHYVLILANTGIRVGEARGLKWMDVESEPTTNGNKAAIVLHVTGKTGSREVVAHSADVRNYFQRIKDLRTKEIGQKPV